MTFLNAWWAWAGLLAGPVILLYLLKMRRQPATVSSTLLWQGVLADMRANTPFQKLRRNLLLLLQLLALAILIFGLCQPVSRAVGRTGSDIVVIVDASASMQATDAPDGQRRFDYAVEQAGELIDNLARADRMMLIIAAPAGVGDRTPLTSSKSELNSVLARAKCYDTSAAVDEALRLAASSLSAAGKTAGKSTGRIFLLSDGVGVTLPEARGLTKMLRYVRVGAGATNAGVTSVSVDATAEGQRVLVGVDNFGPETTQVLVNFYYGTPDNWIDTKELTLDARSQGTAAMTASLPAGRLWVKLESNGDLLAVDNQAFVVLSDQRKLAVTLVSAGNPVLSRYLAAAQLEGWLEPTIVAPDEYAPDGRADVTIFDSFAPADAALPAGEVVLINPPTSVGPFVLDGALSDPQVVNARTEADVLRFVNTSDLRIAAAGRYTHGGAAVDLITAGDGALLAYTTEGASRRYLMAFHLADSSWATDPGFLILLSNILDRARSAHYVGRSQMIASGTPARIGPADGQVQIVDPLGRTHDLPAGTGQFAGTTNVGFYQVQREQGTRDFAVNLLSASESDIVPRVLNTSTGTEIQASTGVKQMNRPLWPWLAGAALAMLMVEWFCYHRRVGQ